MNRRSALSLVIPDVPPKLSLTAADALAELVPELLAAEREVVRLRRLMDEQRARLARERGLSFIRDEHVRREFGGHDDVLTEVARLRRGEKPAPHVEAAP